MTVANRVRSSVEFDLLLQAARASLGERAQARLGNLDPEEIEWEHFLYLTQYHRVTELVYQALRKHAPHAIKGEVENFLRNVAHRTVAYNMMLVGELGRLKQMLGREGVPFITFKGPVLAQEAYGNLGLRSSVDLDLLVRAGDFKRLHHLLEEDGYELGSRVKEMTRLQRRAYLRLAKQISFINKTRMIGLDVHTDVMPPGYYYPFSFDELLSRSRTVRVGPAEVQAFEAEDMVHLLCFHGVKNRWDQLKYVCDVREFVISHPGLDWDLVMRRAEKIRGERILYHGLSVAHRLLDLQLPVEVQRRVHEEAYSDSLVDLTRMNLLNSHDQMLSGRDRMRFYLTIQDDLVNRARYVLYSVMRHVGGVIDI